MVNDLHPDKIVLVADGNMQGCFLLISAIQPHHQVLLSVKKSCAACMLSFHRRLSKKVAFEIVRQIYGGPTVHQQLVMFMLMAIKVFASCMPVCGTKLL